MPLTKTLQEEITKECNKFKTVVRRPRSQWSTEEEGQVEKMTTAQKREKVCKKEIDQWVSNILSAAEEELTPCIDFVEAWLNCATNNKTAAVLEDLALIQLMRGYRVDADNGQVQWAEELLAAPEDETLKNVLASYSKIVEEKDATKQLQDQHAFIGEQGHVGQIFMYQRGLLEVVATIDQLDHTYTHQADLWPAFQNLDDANITNTEIETRQKLVALYKTFSVCIFLDPLWFLWLLHPNHCSDSLQSILKRVLENLPSHLGCPDKTIAAARYDTNWEATMGVLNTMDKQLANHVLALTIEISQPVALPFPPPLFFKLVQGHMGPCVLPILLVYFPYQLHLPGYMFFTRTNGIGDDLEVTVGLNRPLEPAVVVGGGVAWAAGGRREADGRPVLGSAQGQWVEEEEEEGWQAAAGKG
ncbi:hypothetical protein B0H17DRAFT_1152869 [Mycena rosella]|uniref:Uncharacterized protein n=1 Tax=Mycena rosella TaxID=1033263 RepID=A0AAD7B9Z7_MYCRO|nr:hypothetical protein B0H17DRAFT_1152869 [Mycena rosella]